MGTRYLRLALLSVLISGAGFAHAADKAVRITKVAGTVQLMKNGVVYMTIKPGDTIPAKIDSNVTFFVVSGTIEMEANGMKISGATGAEFTPSFSRGSMVVSSMGRGSVEVKSGSGHSVLMPTGSEVRLTRDGKETDIEVQKGRAVVTDASGGGTRVMNAGDTFSIPSTPVPPAAAPKDEPKKDEPKKDEPKDTDNPADTTVFVPESNVIVTQEATESNEVSGSTP